MQRRAMVLALWIDRGTTLAEEASRAEVVLGSRKIRTATYGAMELYDGAGTSHAI